MRFVLAFLGLSLLIFIAIGCDENPTSNVVEPAKTAQAEATASLTATGAATLPVARFTISPLIGDIQTMYRFDASNSEGSIQNYAWNFGDGTAGTGLSVEHKFSAKGRYRIQLDVSDGTTVASTTKRIRVRSDVSGDGGGGGGDTGGTKCSYSNPPRDVWMFTVLSQDPVSRTITAKFQNPAGCNDVFYLCGDVRIGGLKPGEKEYWIGSICEMWSLGNNTFRIHLVDGRYWVNTGETRTYVWPQYDCNPSVVCKAFGY